MKQELIMWALINNVTQRVVIAKAGCPRFYLTRAEARFYCDEEKHHGNRNARVRKVKVTIEEAE
jgi:hypothetical protein